VLAIPGFVGSGLDPLIGVLGDTGRRRFVLLAGGLAFAVSAALTSASVGFWTLLVALVLGNPASGAFVSLSQATLVDLGETERERRMAWWTLAGSFGYVGGPVLLGGALAIGLGWRGAMLGLALAALALVALAGRVRFPKPANGPSLLEALRDAVTALRRREVVRWLAVLEAADLLLDVFHAFLALYFVDVVGTSVVDASLAVAVWTGAGLIGDALLIPVLRRVRGVAILRATAFLVLACYPVFLLTPGFAPKLVLLGALGLLNSGWYAIPKAGLYGALPGRSGAAIAVGGLAGLVGTSIPLGVGALAEAVGLGAALWLLLAAPVALLLLVPRR
jgi:FSR family fosmidomycin resistance protein-like MFS transporter